MNPTSLRILCVTGYYKPAYAYGGPVKSASALYEAMAREGASVTVLTTDANGVDRLKVPLGQPVMIDGVSVWYFPLLSRISGFFFVPGQNAAIRRMVPNFDLIVADAFWSSANLVAGCVARKFNVPYVIPLRGQLNPWALRHHGWKKAIYLAFAGRKLLNRAVAIHCTDPVEVQSFRKINLDSPTYIFPNGVDLCNYQILPARNEMRQCYGIPSNASLLLFLGRLSRIKNPDLAIDALAAALAANHDVHLMIAGPDEENLRTTLVRYGRELGCQDRVHITGLLSPDKVLSALAEADLLLMPTGEQENFGMSALEALAAGVPVLTSPRVPVGWWAVQAGAGRVAECNKRAFSRATCELLADPAELREMGARGRELAHHKFDIITVAKQKLAHFDSLIGTDSQRKRQ